VFKYFLRLEALTPPGSREASAQRLKINRPLRSTCAEPAEVLTQIDTDSQDFLYINNSDHPGISVLSAFKNFICGKSLNSSVNFRQSAAKNPSAFIRVHLW